LRINEKKEERRRKKKELECGPMPNVMASQPNIGGALFESLADPTGGVPCRNAANIGIRKTWTQSEFCT